MIINLGDVAVLTIGRTSIGTGIPLFLSAPKSRKKRDLLKIKYMDSLIDDASLQQTEFLNSSENEKHFKK